MEINIEQSIFEIRQLIKDAPLTEQERTLQINNVQGLKKLFAEWQKQKDEIQRLKKELQQSKEQDHGNNNK